MKKVFLILFLFTLPAINAAGSQSHIVDVIDTPTASSVDFGSYSISFRLYDQGSILTRLFYGIIMKNLTLGLSFDTENIIGSKDMKPRRPRLYIKLPLYDGNYTWPALSVGFDEQGFGIYNDNNEEYQFLPMGFFLVFTKMDIAPSLNVGLGVNADYSLRQDADEKIKGFVNADYTVTPKFMLLAEGKSLGQDVVWGNLAAKYMLNPDLHFEFAVLNLGGRGKIERILRVTYNGMF